MENSIMLHKQYRVLSDALRAIEYTESSPEIVELNFITDDGKPIKEEFNENQYQYKVNIHQPPIGGNS